MNVDEDQVVCPFLVQCVVLEAEQQQKSYHRYPPQPQLRLSPENGGSGSQVYAYWRTTIAQLLLQLRCQHPVLQLPNRKITVNVVYYNHKDDNFVSRVIAKGVLQSQRRAEFDCPAFLATLKDVRYNVGDFIEVSAISTLSQQ